MIKLLSISIAVVAFCRAQDVPNSWDHGAPCSVEHSLKPGVSEFGLPIGNQQEPPYHISVLDSQLSKVQEYVPGETYLVRLIGTSHFKAFVLQARLATSDAFIIGNLRAGRFVEQPDWESYGVKHQECGTNLNNSVTNTDFSQKSIIEVPWQIQSNVGPVQFFATVVQEQDIYWQRWQPRAALLTPKGSKPSVVKQATAETPLPTKPTTTTTEKPEDLPDFGVIKPRPSSQEVDEFEQTAESTTSFSVKVDIRDEIANNPNVHVLAVMPASAHSRQPVPTTPQSGLTTARPQPPPGLPDLPRAQQSGGSQGSPARTSATRTLVQFTTVPPTTVEVFTTHIAPDAHPTTRSDLSSVTFDATTTVAPSTTTEEIELLRVTPQADDTHIVRVVDPRTNRVRVIVKNKINYCAVKPCENDGKCTNLYEDDDYICECRDEWTGKNCEFTTHCAAHACMNDGICRNSPTGYTCECDSEWAGRFCEHACPSALCTNGGTCAINSFGNDYMCICAPGWTGAQCQTNIDECEGAPCLNGGICTDGDAGFECECAEGYMGPICHRPCQNIYHSCVRWDRESRCENMRKRTDFFDVNCGVTCGTCTHKPDTVRTDKPLPPVLEPFTYLIGGWYANSSTIHRHPVDFGDAGEDGYTEYLEFAVAEVPMFGTPSINFTSDARSRINPDEGFSSNGFLTINSRAPTDRPPQVALMTVSSDGLTMIEEGRLVDDTMMELGVQYIIEHPDSPVKNQEHIVEKSERVYYMSGPWLTETIKRTYPDGSKRSFTKRYNKINRFRSF